MILPNLFDFATGLLFTREIPYGPGPACHFGIPPRARLPYWHGISVALDGP